MEGLIMPCMILKRKPHVLFSVFLLGRQGQDPFFLPFLWTRRPTPLSPNPLSEIAITRRRHVPKGEREEAPLSDGRTGRERERRSWAQGALMQEAGEGRETTLLWRLEIQRAASVRCIPR